MNILKFALLLNLAATISFANSAAIEEIKKNPKPSLVSLQAKIEQVIEQSNGKKEILLELEKALADIQKKSMMNFDQKALAAIKNEVGFLSKMEAAFEAEKLMKVLEDSSKAAKPAYLGRDHAHFARSLCIASLARGMATNANIKNKASWHFLAGEAQFSATQTGKNDFEKFLKLENSDKNSRVQQAKLRIKQIQKLDDQEP